MTGWVTAGVAPQAGLPSDRLGPEEFAELQRLLSLRGAVMDQVAVLDQRLELLLLAARDRRGLTGRIRVRPEDGTIDPGGE